MAGWAVKTLIDRCRSAKAPDRDLLPFLLRLIVDGGIAGSEDERDPRVLYLLAKQQWGGLTAVTPAVMDACALARTVLCEGLTQQKVPVCILS